MVLQLAAKVMVSRMALILWVLQSRDIFWLYEQPASSVLWYHPRMQELLNSLDCFRCFTWMGSFGGHSPKGTVLWSSRPGVKKLARVLPDREWEAEMTTKSFKANGDVAVTGGRDLKKSQSYTADFAMSTLAVWLEEREPKVPDLEKISLPNFWAPLSKKNRWVDAQLDEVFQYLSTN